MPMRRGVHTSSSALATSTVSVPARAGSGEVATGAAAVVGMVPTAEPGTVVAGTVVGGGAASSAAAMLETAAGAPKPMTRAAEAMATTRDTRRRG